MKAYSFLSIWLFFHKHSRFTGQLRKGEALPLHSATSTRFLDTWTLAGQLMRRAN